jgi:uncharacterized OB-fold protein
MVKHKFEQSVDEGGQLVGVRCTRCGVIVLFENGRIPDDLQKQDCPHEDFSQAAARIVREATK